jgi:hypothetical protein
MKDKAVRPTQAPKPAEIEERGIDATTVAAVVSATASVVGAGASVYSAVQGSKPADTRPADTPPADPPQVLLPPGVDGD